MKNLTKFYKSIILEVLFLVGAIGICVGYYFVFTEASAEWGKFLCGMCAFALEFIWMIFLSFYVRKNRLHAKLWPSHLFAVVCLVIIASILNSKHEDPEIIALFITSIGIFSYLFSMLWLSAFLPSEDELSDDDDNTDSAG